MLALLHCLPQDPCQVPALGAGSAAPPESKEDRPSRTESGQTRFEETDQSLSAPSLAADVWKNADSKIYTLIRYSTEHRFRSLAVHLPRSSDGQTVRLFLTRSPAQVAYTLVRFEAERLGDWPQVPEPLFAGTTERSRHITLHAPQANATRGVLAYRATGEVELVWQQAPDRDDPLPVLVRPGTQKQPPAFTLEKYGFEG